MVGTAGSLETGSYPEILRSSGVTSPRKVARKVRLLVFMARTKPTATALRGSRGAGGRLRPHPSACVKSPPVASRTDPTVLIPDRAASFLQTGENLGVGPVTNDRGLQFCQ